MAHVGLLTLEAHKDVSILRLHDAWARYVGPHARGERKFLHTSISLIHPTVQFVLDLTPKLASTMQLV